MSSSWRLSAVSYPPRGLSCVTPFYLDTCKQSLRRYSLSSEDIRPYASTSNSSWLSPSSLIKRIRYALTVFPSLPPLDALLPTRTPHRPIKAPRELNTHVDNEAIRTHKEEPHPCHQRSCSRRSTRRKHPFKHEESCEGCVPQFHQENIREVDDHGY
jgi:hypothetical protein